MWAHILHRVSGLAIVLYLLMHIWVIHHLHQGGRSFDDLMESLHGPLFRMGEAALLAAILFHAINGIRLILIDCGIGMERYRLTFWIVFGICAVLGITGGVVLVFF
jgi:succinate dehydrogenase / fumarate reductase cytochrome b subunit